MRRSTARAPRRVVRAARVTRVDADDGGDGPAPTLVCDNDESLRALGIGVWPSSRAFREWLPTARLAGGEPLPFAIVGRRHVARVADVLAAIGLADRALAEPAAKVYDEAEVIALATRRKAGAR
jgi:hypothetical protein